MLDFDSRLQYFPEWLREVLAIAGITNLVSAH